MHIKPETLKALRESVGWSKAVAAKTLSVSPQTYAKWESGIRPMPEAYALLMRTKTATVGAHLDSLTVEPHWTSGEILALRESLGMTQKQFAKAVGISRTTAHSWERGDVSPKPDKELTLDEMKEGRWM